MTSEQFTYWLAGYLKGMMHNESQVTLSEVLENMIEEITDKNSKIYYKGC